MSCTRDATVKAAVRFAPLLAFLLLSLVGFNLCLTILKEASRLKGRKLDICTGAVPRDTNSIYFTNYVTGASPRREGMCYREYPP